MQNVLPLPATGTQHAGCEVLISGAGPVGLTTGCLLRKAGIDVVIVDPHYDQGQASKAAVTLPRSLEVLEQCGAAAEVMSLGRTTTGFRMSVTTTSWQGAGTNMAPKQPCRFQGQDISQFLVEGALLRSYLKLGGRIFRAARVTNYEEIPEGVFVDVERYGYVRPPAVAPQFPRHLTQVQKTRIFAQYIVGCDGKNSKVRECMGGVLTGKDYPQAFFLADVHWPEEAVKEAGMDKHTIQAVVSSGVFVFAVRMQGDLWRLYYGTAGLERSMLSEEYMWDAFRKYWPAPGLPKGGVMSDLQHFTVNCKHVDEYRKGRCILAGDAAHHHSPAGGQGMNTGIQDAANLAWKLTAVIRGHGGDSLLNTYATERIPVAKWVLDTSDGLFTTISKVTSPVQAFLRSCFIKTVFCCVSPHQVPPEFIKGRMFGLTINYRAAGTCKDLGTMSSSSKALKAGDRFPDLPCFDRDGTLVYTLKLLADQPGFGRYHAYFIEGSPTGDEERSSAETAFSNVIAQRLPVRPIFYTSKKNTAKPDTPNMTLLMPQDMPLLPTLQDELRLAWSEKALVVVRPDGYVAVVQKGHTWDGAGVGAALVKFAGIDV